MVVPAWFIQLKSQEKAGLIEQHGIDAHDKLCAVAVRAGQMATNHGVRDRKESLVMTPGAFDPRLLTDALKPFIGTGRRKSGFARLVVDVAARIDVLAASEEIAEESDLRFGRGAVMDRQALFHIRRAPSYTPLQSGDKTQSHADLSRSPSHAGCLDAAFRRVADPDFSSTLGK